MARAWFHGAVRTWRGIAATVACCTLLGGCSYELLELQPELPANAQSSVIYARDGTEIVTLHAEENRTDLTLAEIPVHVRDAVIAVEDERFWLHNGVDLRAILRAVGANASSGEVTQGGSTITQQLVKQLLLGSEQTLDRKVQEAALAWQLEDRYTKERILELYLNTIYLGNGAYGLSAASHEYFGKTPAELTVAEGALLAGLIRAPGSSDPYDEPFGHCSCMRLGAGNISLSGIPSSSAAASTIGLNDEPVWRPTPVARLNFAWSPGPKKSRPPTMTRTWPVWGSMATRAAAGPFGSGRISLIAASAANCWRRSIVVWIRSPPVNSRSRRSRAVRPKRGSSRIHCLTSSTPCSTRS